MNDSKFLIRCFRIGSGENGIWKILYFFFFLELKWFLIKIIFNIFYHIF